MNQILATLAISYASPYFYRLALDLFTSIIVNKTSSIAKKEIKKAWTNITGSVEEIEYELIDIDSDQIVFVNSQERKKSIDASWNTLSPGPTFENKFNVSSNETNVSSNETISDLNDVD